MWGEKFDNAVALVTSLYGCLRTQGYPVKSYNLSTELNEIESMTYEKIADSTTSGGTQLKLVDTLKGVRILVTDSEDDWIPKFFDKNLILIYDSNKPKSIKGVKCNFAEDEVISIK